MSSRARVGREAEARAADYLVGQGFTIVTRRYRARRGEIDLVALDGEVLVFVEVKARLAPGYSPEEAITRSKLAALARAAADYRARCGGDEREYRFDLVAFDGSGVRHHRDLLAP